MLTFSINIMRRHSKTGQRVIAYAEHYPEGEKGGRGKLSLNGDNLSPAFRNKVAMARLILKHNPQLAKKVKSGATTLSAAYRSGRQSYDYTVIGRPPLRRHLDRYVNIMRARR